MACGTISRPPRRQRRIAGQIWQKHGCWPAKPLWSTSIQHSSSSRAWLLNLSSKTPTVVARPHEHPPRANTDDTSLAADFKIVAKCLGKLEIRRLPGVSFLRHSPFRVDLIPRSGPPVQAVQVGGRVPASDDEDEVVAVDDLVIGGGAQRLAGLVGVQAPDPLGVGGRVVGEAAGELLTRRRRECRRRRPSRTRRPPR